jgi:ATP-dependent protease ClpP protease subunit
MSAGVLIMAAGTKGRRKIGENCRVMLHGVASGHVGQIHNLENELDEAKWTQNRYVKALVKETDMTEKYIKKLFDRRQNVYLTAEESVELGIADEVF